MFVVSHVFHSRSKVIKDRLDASAKRSRSMTRETLVDCIKLQCRYTFSGKHFSMEGGVTRCVFVTSIFLVVSLVSPVDTTNDQPVVRTGAASIRGKRLLLQPRQLPDFRKNVLAFTGIPYAEAPVGELRFARPVPKVLRGEFDATQESTACTQMKEHLFSLGPDVKTSEDCLYLDVFVPEPTPHSAAVMVWLHGGGYHMRAGTISNALPTPLAAFGDVILVTLNYRLGPLGFLATGDESLPANIGLLDQRQALLWVRDHIADFGGDPDRVTIFGQSAGSASINFHLLSTLSAGLFSRAIMQSGASNSIWSHHASMEEAINMTFDIGKELGCDVSTSVALVLCLRQKPAEAFIEIYNNKLNAGARRFFVRPVADGQFLLDDPFKMASQGSFSSADVMIGCLENEGSMMILPAMNNHGGYDQPFFDYSSYRDRIGAVLHSEDPLVIDMTAYVFSSADELEKTDADYASSITEFLGDIMFLCPTFVLSEQLAKANRNVYTYLMTHVPSQSIWGENYTWLGAAHGDDLPYVFGFPLAAQSGAGEETDFTTVGRFGNDQEVQISLQIMEYWSNFAKTGNPNLNTTGTVSDPLSKYSVWPRFTTIDPSYKDLSLPLENRQGKVKANECHYLEKHLPSLLQNAAEVARLKSLLEDNW